MGLLMRYREGGREGGAPVPVDERLGHPQSLRGWPDIVKGQNNTMLSSQVALHSGAVVDG